jgi:3'-phosphoadenosine 5'-phosphosulfate sulfotransferase (PAPS reductase)/FAD synthetase
MNKLEQQLRAGLVYSKTQQYKNRLRITIQSLNRFFELTENPYLALSFGKQSIVLAHIIYQIRPETPMILLRSWETFLLHDMERVIEEFMQTSKINLKVNFKDNVSWNDWNWQTTRDYGQNDIQKMGDEVNPDWDGVIMGLSKDESVARRISCSSSNTDWKTIFQYKDGRYRCTPIQFWQLNDLAAYISTNSIPLLSAYSNGLEVRTTARITRNCAEMNGLIDLKHRDISSYNLIIKRFPELSTKG